MPIAVLTQTIGSTTTGSVMTDNSDTANVSAVGSWPLATAPIGYQGVNYQTHAIATAGSADSFTWNLNIPASFTGKFWVQARWPADASRASDATYTVTDRNGGDFRTVDQRGNNNTWVTLALKKQIVGGPDHSVTLSSSGLGTVSADAVRMLPAVFTTNINYVFADHLNTPRVITRASDNKIVWRWDQANPYGVKQPNENPNALGTFTYNPRFPGQLYDAETGLYYNMARYYDPKTGTYTQSDPIRSDPIRSDPIGLAGGVNTYTYVLNNPVNWIDPLGLFGSSVEGGSSCLTCHNS
jgi:RHS repeat-associated protein